MRTGKLSRQAIVGVLAFLQVATIASITRADDAGLVAHWDFNHSLQDTAGVSEDHLATVVGQARFVSADQLPGTIDGAVALGVEPGDAEYLVAKGSPDVRLGPNYTIEAWIHPTQIGGWNRLVLHWGRGPIYAYHLAIHDGVLSLCHGQADGKYLFSEGGRVVKDQLQHVAGVAQRHEDDPAKSTLTVYLNGRPAATTTFDGTIGALSSEGLGVGDSADIPSRGTRFVGYVDQLAVWNRALSVGEIEAHADAPRRAEAVRRSELARDELRRRRIKTELARQADAVDRLKQFGVEEIVFAERGYGRDYSGHYYANFGYSCTDPDVWLHADNGGKLSKLNLSTGEMTDLVDDPGGSIRDPQVDYDGRKILFSYRKGGTHRYHLYEINTDGTALKQLTDGAWDDVEPTYLPGGDIVFCSTRCHRWIGCWLAETAILFLADSDGENIRMLSSGSFTENTPAVLPDGRVLYTRWEYVNRDPVSFHHLWTMNPDGTGQMVYFGNMIQGGVFIDARPIPATNRIVLINTPGHGRNEHEGYVATLTGTHGPNDRAAMKNISKTADYRDPYPLSDDTFLVARKNQILLMDSEGKAETLFWGSGLPLHEPRPIFARPREAVTPPKADFALTAATLLVADVYSGRNMAGVGRGTIKKLLVLEDLPKPANFHGGGSQPIGHGVTSTLKRILGTVPVEPDGSACFEVPPMRSIYFALLDANDESIKQMRSFVTLQPGEKASCVGCHEPRETTSAVTRRTRLDALTREPSKIEPIPHVPEIMDFPRDVQPILDRHCVRCHNHERRDGGVVLLGDRGPVFSLSYYAFYLHWQIKDTGGDPQHGAGREPGNNRPYTTYSSASPLVDKLEPVHYDVQLTPHEKRLIRLWIDVGATYPGTYAAYGSGQIGGSWRVNEPIRVMADDWPSTPPARDAIARRCAGCHPEEQLPQHVTARTGVNQWGDMLSWTRPLSRYSRHRIYNLSRPEKSLVLLAPLARQAGGYADGETITETSIANPVPEDRSSAPRPVPEDRSSAPRPVPEDRSRPPQPIEHPIVFSDVHDPDYQKILDHIQTAKEKLEEIKRFDMPGFQPNEHYVREMKRYGVLPASLELGKDPIDVYVADQAYFETFWYRPNVNDN